MKNFIKISHNASMLMLVLSFIGVMQATESSEEPHYYKEFNAAMHIANTLYALVNKTDIDVKGAMQIKNGSLQLLCDPSWNTTDQGLVLYFEEKHPTKLYTPFGSLMLFWFTEEDKKWDCVLGEFKESCVLKEPTFNENARAIISMCNEELPVTQKIVQGNQKRTDMLTACITKFLKSGGTLTKLESLDARKKKLAHTRKQLKPLTIFDMLFRPFDLSS
ncbi:MAG: hypothetical protein K2X90_04640 [Candidatus Babeliaceae bacterium]|nr:hypothetical protein [Candidatus Babeliaceae bacterium]